MQQHNISSYFPKFSEKFDQKPHLIFIFHEIQETYDKID